MTMTVSLKKRIKQQGCEFTYVKDEDREMERDRKGNNMIIMEILSPVYSFAEREAFLLLLLRSPRNFYMLCFVHSSHTPTIITSTYYTVFATAT